MQVVFFIFSLIFLIPTGFSQATFEESRQASEVVGKWLSKSLGHFDFLSATPLALRRDDYRFYVYERDHVQYSSDYGLSYMQVPVTSDVLNSYETLGFSTAGMSKKINLTRAHINLGFTNRHDLTIHAQQSFGGISGWGVGHKYLFYQKSRFFFAHRLAYSEAFRSQYFEQYAITNDLSMAFYLRLIDLYVGLRHSIGKITFEPSVNYLALPPVRYNSGLTGLDYYYGVVLSPSYNTRLTLQYNQVEKERAWIFKLSFHFDSFKPKKFQLFNDPRYFKIW